jgi:hypothetical protein
MLIKYWGVALGFGETQKVGWGGGIMSEKVWDPLFYMTGFGTIAGDTVPVGNNYCYADVF